MELVTKEDGQEYAQVLKLLGDCRCSLFCFDGVTRIGHIRGKMRKRVWVQTGDTVLVATREYQDEKVDIVHKYTAEDVRRLKQIRQLPESGAINEGAMGDDMFAEDDLGIDFDEL